MSSDLVRDIVYEDDKVIAYADYDLVGRINYEEHVNLWIVNKQETNGNDYEKI
jgi:hypothetical protein